MGFGGDLGFVENESTIDAFTFCISGNILVFRKLKNKPKQLKNVLCQGFGIFYINEE